MAWTTPSTWTAGATLTAAQLNAQLRDNLKAIGDPWTSYTPTFTNWTLGNGTITGSYMQAGKYVWGNLFYTVGSTDTKSGTLVLSLPVTKAADGGGQLSPLGVGTAFDTSAGTINTLVAAHNTTTRMFFYTPTSGLVTASVPWTWATGDQLSIEFFYQAA